MTRRDCATLVLELGVVYRLSHPLFASHHRRIRRVVESLEQTVAFFLHLPLVHVFFLSPLFVLYGETP
ncbi:hypothetical protein [Haladaptatus litoreus]|uniref:hypothetical protein n=1 Tax=Haladaptatus litoreus TaxID=553468 RepID=UPI00158D7ECB|nr:hypothetical protein [Haladaptatus litoreus]